MRHLQQRLKRVRMLICDVDGVLTDGRLWIDTEGKWRRFFHVKDGVGMKLLMDLGYDVGVISGGKSDDVVQRMGFLNIKHFYLEALDKTGPFEEILKSTGYKVEEIAFIGDEIFDIPILKRVGFAATVPNAVAEVKKSAHYVTKIEGGYGAVREIVDLIRAHGSLAKKGKAKKMTPWYKSTIGWVLLACFFMALFALSGLAKADTVEFPESELARESVLPVFDQPEAVKKRYVPTDGRVEIQGFLGTSLNDPFLYNYPFGGEVDYHLTEIHSVGLLAEGFGNTNTSYVSQIQQVNGASQKIPFSQNPSPTFSVLGQYEFTPYYGKISLSKQTVMNLNISAEARVGMINLNVGGSSVTAGLGLNERFFFTRNFGLKIDLSALIYQKPDILSQTSSNTTVTELFITLGAVWLLPNL